MEQEFIPLLNRLGIETNNINAIHWIGTILCIVLLFYVSSFVCQRIVIPIVNSITKKTRIKWDDIILSSNNLKQLCNLVVGILLMALLKFIVYESSQLHGVVTKISSVYITIVFTSLCCGLLTSFYQISNQAERTKNHTLQGVFQMLKIIVICIGTIIVASIIIDKDPTKLLAGLGASAAVLMLVFKDSIMGLVAGVQLAANDMLHPGDWITVEKYGADGTVLDVTLTTVKVENWDKTITTIPPYALVSDSFQNWRGMFNSGGRRIKRSIYIDMSSISFCNDTLIATLLEKGILKEADKEKRQVNLTVFRQWLEEWLRNHPSVNKKMMIMVRQLQPTSQGLPLELYFFFDGTGWVDYEHLQAEIFEQVFALLPQFGLKVFQSPTGNDIKCFVAN
ncbi:MAG: mechanosensitive ion channel [Bacteroidaceae bacterium]|nr:mechanosensitive ion channel [Bacteroidaceae bacterium]